MWDASAAGCTLPTSREAKALLLTSLKPLLAIRSKTFSRDAYKRPEYQITHKCLACGEIMKVNPYRKRRKAPVECSTGPFSRVVHLECLALAARIKRNFTT